MQVRLDIDPTDEQTKEDLKRLFSRGEFDQGPAGASLELVAARQEKSSEFGVHAMTFLLSIPAGVAANLLSNWLWEKLKGRAKGIAIETIKVELNESEIERVIVERIELKDPTKS